MPCSCWVDLERGRPVHALLQRSGYPSSHRRCLLLLLRAKVTDPEPDLGFRMAWPLRRGSLLHRCGLLMVCLGAGPAGSTLAATSATPRPRLVDGLSLRHQLGLNLRR